MKPSSTEIGDFALLKVISVEHSAAFLDWGQANDLVLPRQETTGPIEPGDEVLVHIYLDDWQRPTASMKLDRFVKDGGGSFENGQRVNLVIAAETDLGFKAIVDSEYWGVLYFDETFRSVSYGEKTQGFIKKVRTDGKLDLTLNDPARTTHRAAQDDIGPAILELLEEKGGFLAINDKTPAEEIYELFGVSKKKYKIALGGLYRERLITVGDDGIRLVKR